MDEFIRALSRIEGAVAILGSGPDVRDQMHDLCAKSGISEEMFFFAWCAAKDDSPRSGANVVRSR